VRSQRDITGVSIFFAVFIVAAFGLAAWDRFQAGGWSEVRPLIAALLIGSCFGAFVEVLDSVLESRGTIAIKILKVVLAAAALVLALSLVAGIWDSGTDIVYALLTGAGLARLSVAGWNRFRRNRIHQPNSETDWR
jgi:O-antigen/teichoic acid export membrane protein